MPGVPYSEQETNNADQTHREDEAPPNEGHGLDTHGANILIYPLINLAC